MKLLILTQYYPPETGAPQNRLHELAVRLKSNGVQVEVLTALPNYPKMEVNAAYKNGKLREELIDEIPVHRAWIYVSKSKGIVSRLLNYFSFVFTSYWRGKKLGKFDYILVESPPLFLGYAAISLSRKLNAKLIFNVSDLWPESAEKLNIVTNKTLLKLAYNLEKKCYHKATLVTGQTQGIVDNIASRFPQHNTYWLPNGVDLNFYNPVNYTSSDFRSKYGFEKSDIIFFYGGILGHAQGLKTVLYAAEKIKKYSNIQIVLQGDGPEKEELMQLKSVLGLECVHFLPSVCKDQMPYILSEIDVALVPLRKLSLFQGAIPSKIFEALAMEKPLLLGVEGEAKMHFIDSAQAGLFFEPENVDSLAEKFLFFNDNRELVLTMGKNGRAYVTEFFNRNKIANDFLKELQNH